MYGALYNHVHIILMMPTDQMGKRLQNTLIDKMRPLCNLV